MDLHTEIASGWKIPQYLCQHILAQIYFSANLGSRIITDLFKHRKLCSGLRIAEHDISVPKIDILFIFIHDGDTHLLFADCIRDQGNRSGRCPVTGPGASLLLLRVRTRKFIAETVCQLQFPGIIRAGFKYCI